MYYSTNHPSPFGTITLACTESGKLCGLWIAGQKYHGAGAKSNLIEKNDFPVFDAAKDWLERYFAGEKPSVSELSLAPVGSEFRQKVWEILCEIPYGEVTTYGMIAKKIAAIMGKDTMSAQAIGGAVGHNPISIIIPCHRVVGSGGSLTGYASGLEVKARLLELERVN